MRPQVHIVGAGLTGATMARLLHNAGIGVTVFERRGHLGGNVHDFVHPSGIRVHTYGPHYFRTNSPLIWEFVQQFGSFYPYRAVVKSLVDGTYENWPISAEYLQRIGATQGSNPSITAPQNFEEAALRLMPRLVYEKFVKNYTYKQWGVEPRKLNAGLIKRFNVHHDNDPHLTPGYRWQGIPTQGYATWVKKMLEGIEVQLNVDYLVHKPEIPAPDYTVFTGAIDAFFGFDLGCLQYRGQQREQVFLPKTQWHQPCAQVNNPGIENGAHIRTLEWKHLMPAAQQQHIEGTVITFETPFSPEYQDQYEYPFPDTYNQTLYQLYRQRAAQIPNLLICGRLGEYRYYDMDQAIGRAMMLTQKHLLPALSANTQGIFSNLSYF